jgi:UDP-N-acetylglucosamine--N-acetylmuramyl-(pentapeptide) pyrophosphoryl-undecaprenol N-acetylglucosamine transferase
MRERRFLIVGGGTGGHISPGIALYEECKRQGVAAFFLAGRGDVRFSYLKDITAGDLYLYRAPAITKNIFKLILFVMSFTLATIRAFALIKRLRISAVIGMGGYISAPALLAAILAKAPLYLCEQNTIPGKVTRFFAGRSRIVFTTFAGTRHHLNGDIPVKHMGNPIRDAVLLTVGPGRAREHFNLGHCRRVVLAIGGSQGSRTINKLILDLKKQFPDEFRNVGLIWSTGDLTYEEYLMMVQEEIEGGSIFMSPFIRDVGLAYEASDVAISRAGAGVMMELAAARLPAILIPYPFAAADHQDTNADEFVNAGAAVKFSDDDAIAEKVAPELLHMLGSNVRLDQMARCMEKVAKRDAAQEIVTAIIKDLRGIH